MGRASFALVQSSVGHGAGEGLSPLLSGEQGWLRLYLVLYVLLSPFHLEGRWKCHAGKWRAGVIWCHGNFPNSHRAAHKMQCWRSCLSHTSPQTAAGGAGAILFLEVALRRAAVALVDALHLSIAPSSLKSLPGQTGKGMASRAAGAVLVEETKAQRWGESLYSSTFKNPPICADALSSFCHLPCFTLFLSFRIIDFPRCFHMLSAGIMDV